MNIHSAVSEILSGGCRDLFEEKVEMSERAPACEKCIVLGVRESRVNKWK